MAEQSMDMFNVPFMGEVPSLQRTMFEPATSTPYLVVKSFAPYKRFAIRVVDYGLESTGLQPGDYALFREQRWPNDECQVCMIAFGEEVTMRIVEGVFNTEPILRVNGSMIPPESRHRNDFIVLGVLDGIIKSEYAVLDSSTNLEDFDWGC